MGQINPESWPDRQVLITRRLRQRRAELGLTQKQVVTRLGRRGLQTTNRAVSSLEHGAGVDVAKLPELALALDCTITYLIGLTDDPHRWEPDPPQGRQPSGRPRPAHDSPPAPEGIPAHSWILGLEVPDRPSRLAAGSSA
jgi:transcriptional regulator with XRE-family HTH domain